jgi:hypothetical protein
MIQFCNFSAQSFERSVQALSVRILGPGVVVFGSGPDGAREATIEGVVPFPSLEERWDGYIVVQAKNKEALKGDARDASWLATQLKREFDKYLKNKSLRRPEYYIIATNVTLSPEAKNGGRAKVERLISQYQKKLKFKAAAIWAADELRAHLDGARDIRMSYSAWLDEAINLVKSIGGANSSRLFGYLATIVEAWKHAKFLDLANDVGRNSTSRTVPQEFIVHAFNSDPSRRGLLSFFRGRVRRTGPPDILKLDESAFQVMSGDSAAMRCAVAQLKLTSGRWGRDDIEAIVSDLGRGPAEFHIPLGSVRQLASNDAYLEFLRSICSNTAAARSFSGNPLSSLSSELSAQPSQLAEERQRRDLELPTLPAV